MQPQLIARRYQMLRAIGRGGMGTVWLCHDEVLGRKVAVKQIGALPGETATETKRAMREARSAAALNHPNAVAIYDVVNHDGRPWLVMEYVEGHTLADEISRDGQLSPQRVADIGAQLAGALARAHERRIVHRDIKPGNVLIDRAGRPKISDFGIARGHGDEQLTQIGFVTGTPGFLSPELARGGDPDSASDVWALGATLYAAVEGKAPYEPRSNPIALLRAIATERPRPMTHAGALGVAINAMMDEDPGRRWDMSTSAQRLGSIAGVNAMSVMPRGPVTHVRAAPVVESTQRLEAAPVVESTQRLEAAPVVESTQRLEAAPVVESTQRLEAAPVVESTQRQEAAPVVESTQRQEAAPVVTAAEAAPPEPVGLGDLFDEEPLPPADGPEGGRPWMPFGLVALLVAVLGVVILSQLGGPGGTTAVQGRTVKATTAARPTATGAPRTSKSPTPSAFPSTSAQRSPSTTSQARPRRTTASPAPNADRTLKGVVRSYYSDVTKDTDRTWVQLTPRMQNAAGGRGGYDGFWRTIERVRVNEIRPTASANKAVVNLTFTRHGGSTSTETHQFTFVNHGGRYLIDSDHPLR
jgi:hypothetical protein